MSDRKLPFDLEAERGVLGGIMVANERMFAVSGQLRTEHFWRQSHAAIYQAMLSLATANTPIDFLTLKNMLGSTAYEEIGPAYLASLMDGVPRATNVEFYARVVIDRWRLRSVMLAADQAERAAFEAAADKGVDVDAVVRSAQEAFYQLSDDVDGETLFDAERLTTELFDDLEQLTKHRGAVTGVSTGLHDLDWLTMGLQPGDLIVIGGRPSTGKTVLGLQFALTASQGGPVLFSSLEMSRQPVWRRALFHTARVDGYRYLRGYLDDATTHRQIAEAMETLRELNLSIHQKAGASPIQIRSTAQRTKLRHGLSLLVVDYLQLMQPSDRSTVKHLNRTQIVGEFARALKELASDLQIPVVVLSQLRRSQERPTMADLRESGDIEAHADVILLLHRAGADEDQFTPGEPVPLELILEKQRNGPTGSINLLNFREQYRFVSAQRGGQR